MRAGYVAQVRVAVLHRPVKSESIHPAIGIRGLAYTDLCTFLLPRPLNSYDMNGSQRDLMISKRVILNRRSPDQVR